MPVMAPVKKGYMVAYYHHHHHQEEEEEEEEECKVLKGSDE